MMFALQETAPESAAEIKCPNCQHQLRTGELVCPSCGALQSLKGRTNKLDSNTFRRLERVRRVGDATAPLTKPITLEIDHQKLLVPATDQVIVGRGEASALLDVDLTPFGADMKGVSRQHFKLIRDHELVHVCDLGSTNGTYLNGIRLIAHQKRLVRSGDELMAGQLCIRLNF